MAVGLERPSGARGANRGRRDQMAPTTPSSRRRGQDVGRGETTAANSASARQQTGGQGPTAGSGAPGGTGSIPGNMTPADPVSPQTRPRTAFGQGIANVMGGATDELRNNPGAMVDYYNQFTGRAGTDGLTGLNMDLVKRLDTIFNLVGGADAGNNAYYLDFVGNMLDQYNTPGSMEYGASDLFQGLANQFISKDGMSGSALASYLADPSMKASEQVDAVSRIMATILSQTTSPMMAQAIMNRLATRGDRFVANAAQGQSQDPFFMDTVNSMGEFFGI